MPPIRLEDLYSTRSGSGNRDIVLKYELQLLFFLYLLIVVIYLNIDLLKKKNTFFICFYDNELILFPHELVLNTPLILTIISLAIKAYS